MQDIGEHYEVRKIKVDPKESPVAEKLSAVIHDQLRDKPRAIQTVTGSVEEMSIECKALDKKEVLRAIESGLAHERYESLPNNTKRLTVLNFDVTVTGNSWVKVRVWDHERPE